MIGWPAVAVFGAASPWIGAANAALVGGICYGLSWLLLGVAGALGGKGVLIEGRERIRGLFNWKR